MHAATASSAKSMKCASLHAARGHAVMAVEAAMLESRASCENARYCSTSTGTTFESFWACIGRATLSGAAQHLGIDQTTVGRRLGGLEGALGSHLFLRATDGFVLTVSGEQVLETAMEMERLAVSFERRSEGTDERVEGEVRVTTTDTLAIDFVIPAIERLQTRHPGIRVLLSTTPRLLDLSRREADIAIHTERPQQQGLIVRRLGRWEVGLYASRSYVARRGEPKPGGEFAGHDLAVYLPRGHEASAGLTRR
nr:LysR family transcriptional regulator [Paraburkholderia sp. CNPSo 3281]